MIDAYEIGIQLLLHEDVSAGLAVITRELAEVDQAIAATSAELVGLAQEAQKTSAAASAAMGHRASPSTTVDQDLGGGGEQVAPQPLTDRDVTPAAAPSGEQTAAAPEMKAANGPVPEVKVTVPVSEGSRSSAHSVPERVVTSSAPVNGSPVRTAEIDQHAGQPEARTDTQQAVAPAPPAPSTPNPEEFGPRLARDVGTVPREPGRHATSPSANVAFTASVSRAQKPEAAVRQSERVRHHAAIATPLERERPVAPWSGVHQRAPQVHTTRSPERAAAPTSLGEERDETGDGTVMLDGRLVGHWLSEHMARDASRPPAGTSFFDPRQTPAWTVSGAL